jgi:hypothetical protein
MSDARKPCLVPGCARRGTFERSLCRRCLNRYHGPLKTLLRAGPQAGLRTAFALQVARVALEISP